ncbi:MAG: RsmE family RNA methyltransferase [Bacteroidota bacterium]|jgi:16S rRNA (uracil1498-N3)-methyltransferase|nr:RsmE family RNA methyltransferase [Bacteroidota bacterium]
MNYFLIPNLASPQILIQGDEHHHLSRVLRLRVGDTVLVGDGRGDVAEAVIEEVEQNVTRCRVLAVHEQFNEPPLEVTLLQGVLKNPSKMDWLVEKSTELGVTSIVPLMTEHTVAHSVKTDRLRKLAETATKQCLRGRIPDISDPLSLPDAIKNYAVSRLLMFHESAPVNATIEALELDERPLAIFIGPEGGFSETEVELLHSRGADILSLGPRRLRGETAGLAALARLNGRME